jgi:hypothetical protein
MNINAKTIGRRVFKTVVGIIVVIAVAQFIWLYSGSDDWKLAIDEGGVKIYTLKTPGDSLVKYKGVFRGKYSLNQLVAGMLDADTESCKRWYASCRSVELPLPWDPSVLAMVNLTTVGMPSPFRARESLFRQQLSQDPDTKEMFLSVSNVLDSAPARECCVRIRNLYNSWRYTPIGNGEVEITFIQNFSPGGYFPDWLFNMFGARGVHRFLQVDFPRLMAEDAYRYAHFDFIDEVDYYRQSSAESAVSRR